MYGFVLENMSPVLWGYFDIQNICLNNLRICYRNSIYPHLIFADCTWVYPLGDCSENCAGVCENEVNPSSHFIGKIVISQWMEWAIVYNYLPYNNTYYMVVS